MMMKACPHCGASLPTEASFCPSCAKSIQPRTEVIPPRHVPRRALYRALLVFLAVVLALALALWLSSRPKTYESDTGELLYTTHSGSWRLLLSKQDPPEPTPENHYHAVVNEAYRDPVPLYAMDPDSGAFLTEEFMENVASITAEIICSEEYLSISCTEPAANDYYPSAAAVTFVDFRLVAPGDYEAELVYTVSMKNGDTLRLTQAKRCSSISVYQYTASDVPMDTIEDLQALVDRFSAASDEYDQLQLYLPAATYEGGLQIKERFVRLYGSIGPDGQRTTFTGPTEISSPKGVLECSDIAFTGSGEGVGIRVSGKTRFHLTNCQVSGWETGFLGTENAWINADETVFSDNTVGLCFNTLDTPLVSDDFYTDNLFRNNGTAVLLESVGSPTSLSFPGTRFTGNGTDIDNRCGQALELSRAVFE